jgi:hypothetical protein
MQETFQVANIDRYRTNQNISILLDDEVKPVARFKLQTVADRLRDNQLSLARERRRGHACPLCNLTYIYISYLRVRNIINFVNNFSVDISVPEAGRSFRNRETGLGLWIINKIERFFQADAIQG